MSGEVPVPGGHLQRDALVAVFHAPIVEPATDLYAGYLFVSPVRHVTTFAELTPAEGSALGAATARWAGALERAGAPHVYVLRVGHAVDHVHLHLVPRWPETPDDVPWTRVDDWEGARRGDVELAAQLVSALIGSLRRR